MAQHPEVTGLRCIVSVIGLADHLHSEDNNTYNIKEKTGGSKSPVRNVYVPDALRAFAVPAGLAITYVRYAVFAALPFVFVQAIVRETRGVELEAMKG